MKITDIKRQKKRKDRFNVYIDGHFGFALSEVDLLKNKIEISSELDEEQMENLKKEDEAGKIMNKAFDYLARRSHSEKELKNKLIRKNYKGHLIEKTIARLKELGYLDDEKFAREWIEYRLNSYPRGRILIKRELLSKGVNIELVEKMLDLVYNRDRERKELAQFLDLRRKKYPQDRKGKNRLISYLLRRGFLWEDIKELLEPESYAKGDNLESRTVITDFDSRG